MNGDEAPDPPAAAEQFVELGSSPQRQVLHRLAAVRRAKGISRRELARRLGITVEELRVTEESTDLSLSTISRWAATLNISVTELVIEQDECLAQTRLGRPQATRLLKLAATIRDRSRARGLQRLAQTFVEQIAEILPSLEELTKKNHGRRPHRQPSSAVPRPLPEHIFSRRKPREY
jgi:transcriptional regulator with XRE-family HTH domain